jgi:hypothetical protein
LQDVQIFNQGPKVVFRFVQDYKSDAKADHGAKMIYALKNASGLWEIVGETWEPIDESQAARQAAQPASGG